MPKSATEKQQSQAEKQLRYRKRKKSTKRYRQSLVSCDMVNLLGDVRISPGTVSTDVTALSLQPAAAVLSSGTTELVSTSTNLRPSTF